jgi:hypothetical protein
MALYRTNFDDRQLKALAAASVGGNRSPLKRSITLFFNRKSLTVNVD